MTGSPVLYDYHNDILGNRAWRNKGKPSGTQRYTWDILNRLESFCTTSSGAVYTYRADGMRVSKGSRSCGELGSVLTPRTPDTPAE